LHARRRTKDVNQATFLSDLGALQSGLSNQC
jgi:hypothetical protein